LDDDAVQQEAEELKERYGGRCRVCHWTDVVGAQCAGLDEDEEAADGKQEGRDDVSRGAIEDEAVDAVELGTWARVSTPGGVLSLTGVTDAVVKGGDERKERLYQSVLFAP
jgi:hypothetical protein